MRATRIILSVGFTLMMAGSALAQKVSVDWDKAANFAAYKTYIWAQGTAAKNPLMGSRIIENVDAQLTAKGLRKVEDVASADLVVLYHAGTDTEVRMNTIDTGMYGYGWGRWGYGGGMGSSTTYVDKVLIGQLVVDIGDVKNKKYLWRGTANATIPSKPEKGEALIQKAVTKMFEKFPPGAAKK